MAEAEKLNAIEAILRKYVPAPKGYKTPDDIDALMLVRAFDQGHQGLDVWNRSDEMQRLERIGSALRSLDADLAELAAHLKHRLDYEFRASAYAHFLDGHDSISDRERDRVLHPFALNQLVQHLLVHMQPSIEIVLKESLPGKNFTEKNANMWPGVLVVDRAREIWFRRIGREAPTTSRDASKFDAFITDLFNELGATVFAKAAIRAWNREMHR